MSEEKISTMAKLYAERLMRGDHINEDEMRVITAGLMLSVDRLTNVMEDLKGALWSEEQLRTLIGTEIRTHCAAVRSSMPTPIPPSVWPAWLGRFFRACFGR